MKKITKNFKVGGILLSLLWFVLVLCCLVCLAKVVIGYGGVILNTRAMKTDFALERVKSIESDGTVVLQDGSNLDEEDVSGYIKLKRGSGTWYDANGKNMFIEMTYKDYLNLLGVPMMTYLTTCFYAVFCKKWGILSGYSGVWFCLICGCFTLLYVFV